jgi:hypothetical protein
LQAQGFVVVAGTPQQFTEFVQAEITKWSNAAKVSGAQVD